MVWTDRGEASKSNKNKVEKIVKTNTKVKNIPKSKNNPKSKIKAVTVKSHKKNTNIRKYSTQTM